MNYIELHIENIPAEQRDILTFLLAEAGFESFEEVDYDLKAYIPEPQYNLELVAKVFQEHPYKFTKTIIPARNWNAEWEKNFSPVEIAGKCYIRAPFHPARENFLYEIVIEPKMSFGTAHHETTSQMIEFMLEMDFLGTKVLDMGCGTGILAILADKMGASQILAVDNDEWAYTNSVENTERNSTRHVTVKQGGIKDVQGDFDCILANINRNVLLDQIPSYSKMMHRGSFLLLSGFYEEDLDLIRESTSMNGLFFENYSMNNRWIAARFRK